MPSTTPPSDLDIARAATLRPLTEVAAKLNIQDELIPYGRAKAKVDLDFLERARKERPGKLILVTAISPTPAGEGGPADPCARMLPS